MSIDYGMGLISKLVETKDFRTVKDQQIKPSFFTGDNSSVFDFIQENFLEHGEVPTERVLKDQFPYLKLMKNPDGSIGTEEGLLFWCNELRKETKHRLACDAIQKSADKLNGLETEEAVVDLRKQLAYIDNEISVSSIVDITKDTEDRVEAYNKRRITGGVEGISTGFKSLDLVTGGLCDETLTTIIAKTGSGKTWLQTYIGAFCMLNGYKVLQGVTEMSTTIMRDRYEAMLFSMMYGGLDYTQYKQGKLPPDVYNQFVQFLKEDLPSLEPLLLRNVTGIINLRADIEDIKPDIILIDGVYMMEDDRGAKDDWLRIAHITRDLKRACKDFNLPVCINTQTDINSKGGLGGVRYSKAINEDSDTVLELIREDTMFTDNEAKLISRKNREGVQTSIMLDWNFSPLHFGEIYSETSSGTKDNTESYDNSPMIGVD